MSTLDSLIATGCTIEARRLRAAVKPCRCTLKAQRSRAHLAAQHVQGLLDSATDERLRITASIALAALNSCAELTSIIEGQELLAAARGEAA